MVTSKPELIREVLDEAPTVRRDVADEHTDARLALQIKALRQQRGWTQEQLARRAGLGQSQVSDYENVNNSSWTAATLKKLAAAFDLPVLASFGSWAEFVDATADLSRGALERPALDDLSQRAVTRHRTPGLAGAGGQSRVDPVIEAYKAGVDRTLLRENLRRTPEERLRNLVQLQKLAAEARRAGAALRRS